MKSNPHGPGYFFLLAFTLAMIVMLTAGCGLLDGLLLDPLTDQDGNALYIDVAATEALTQAERDEGKAVLVKESDRVPGKVYEQAYSDNPSGVVGMVGSAANLIPGWGALGGGILSLLVGGYAAVRGKRKVNAAIAGKKSAVIGMGLLAEVIKDYSDGKLDEDKDGSIDVTEIGHYLKKKGLEHLNPDFVQKVINVGASSLETSEKQKALAKLASEL